PYTEAYVNGVFRDALGRAADAGALSWFTQRVDHGEPASSVPAAIVKSGEYAANLVQTAYHEYLGRDAEPGAIAFWGDPLGSGMRDEQLVAALVGSDEFYNRAGGNDADWIAAAYQAVLSRAPDPADIQWATGLLSSGASRGAVALDIASSIEHERQVVNAEYEQYLHAPPDSGGWTYWATEFATGQATSESLASVLMSGNTYYEAQTGAAPSIVPVPVDLVPWTLRDAQIAAAAADNHGPVVFVGDSITQAWQLPAGESVWDQYYAPLDALDAGMGGDTTQNVLWRIESGELDGLAPKVVVLMIGINNIIAGDSPQEVAQGVAADIAALRRHLPESKILLLSILPAVLTSDGRSFLAPAEATNQLIARFADGQNVFYVNLWPVFANPDGTYRPDLHVADGVHLDTEGYTVFAQAIAPELHELLIAP
ncbi:MAG: GDSL-type esterase/lipase family protein, partial [Pirellulales bacterium]